MKSKEYWDKTFETRYTDQNKDESRPPLKVVLVPHSHNDPGWLKTFVNYFQSDSREILNLIVMKLQEYKEMTFIWSEISILQLWWDQGIVSNLYLNVSFLKVSLFIYSSPNETKSIETTCPVWSTRNNNGRMGNDRRSKCSLLCNGRSIN